VYCGNIPVEAENNISMLPSTCRPTEALRLGPVKISNDEYARIICIKARQDEMDVVGRLWMMSKKHQRWGRCHGRG
jgi:hypothetical protein